MCWQIGGSRCIHPDVLSDNLTIEQIGGWVAWMQREPRGERLENNRLAILRHDIRAPYVEQAESVEDLLPRFRQPEVEEVEPEVQALLDTFYS